MNEQRRAAQREAERITVVGAVVGGTLAAGQLVAGIVSQSQAIVADAIHSFSDLLTDAVTWWALRLSSSPADANHPWGHGKFQTVASLLMGGSLLVTAWELGRRAVVSFGALETLTAPSWIAPASAFAVIVGKELLARWTERIAVRQGNELLRAKAWHHRSDALSSVGAFVGTLGAMYGWTILDPIAALLIALFIARVGASILWSAAGELAEGSAPPEVCAAVQRILDADEAVIDAHRLRLRRVGPSLSGDVHLTVEDTMTAAELHALTERLEAAVRAQYPELESIYFHLDPQSHVRAVRESRG